MFVHSYVDGSKAHSSSTIRSENENLRKQCLEEDTGLTKSQNETGRLKTMVNDLRNSGNNTNEAQTSLDDRQTAEETGSRVDEMRVELANKQNQIDRLLNMFDSIKRAHKLTDTNSAGRCLFLCFSLK